MRIAVISDIHSNADAFSAVLADMETASVEEVISLGDNIGYGPEPEAVIQLLRERKIPSVIGNHEFGLVDTASLEWFNSDAKKALRMNAAWLSEDSKSHIKTFQPFLEKENAYYVHGFPPDSFTTYVVHVGNDAMMPVMMHMRVPICFVGHTHDLNISYTDGKQLIRHRLKKGVVRLKQDWRYIINVGSVGQPRDGDKRAKYVIFDTTSYSLEVRFVPYDAEETAIKIKRLGLPFQYAFRLL